MSGFIGVLGSMAQAILKLLGLFTLTEEEKEEAERKKIDEQMDESKKTGRPL